MALDLGSGESPYRDVVARRGFELRTLDVTAETHPDYVGTAEESGLDSEAFDLVICTQVIEHVDDPWRSVREIARILKPGGSLIVTVPHAVGIFVQSTHMNVRIVQPPMRMPKPTAGRGATTTGRAMYGYGAGTHAPGIH